MTFLRRLLHARARDERGDGSLLLVATVLALVVAVGFVVDGGGKLRSDDRAQYAAEQAARAAGQQIAASQAQAGARPGVDTGRAVQAANAALSANGVSGSVTVSGGRINVATTSTYNPKMLSIIGIGSLTSTGSAHAEVTRGITQEGQ